MEDDGERIESLFKKLDYNNDGTICVQDLKNSFREMNILQLENSYNDLASEFLQKSDLNKDGKLDFMEFANYFRLHNQKLKLAFKHIDRNNDGHLDAREIQTAFGDLGVNINIYEAEKLLKRVDQDKTLKIDFNEWRDYFFFHPTGEIQDMVKVWHHAESKWLCAHQLLDKILDLGNTESAGVVSDTFEVDGSGWDVFKRLTCGAVAGFMSRTMTAPLDRLKVMRQVHGYKHTSLSSIQSFAWMVKEGGWTSMWRGNGINVAKVVPEMAFRFCAFEAYKRHISRQLDSPDEHSLSVRFFSGAMAGATAQTIIYPLEVVKTRMCLRKTGQFGSIADCVRTMYSERGIRSFYRGYLINLIGVFPYAGIELCCYETLRQRYSERFSLNSEGKPPAFLLLGIASLSTITGVVSCYPLSLAKTKLQSKSHFRVSERNNVFGLFDTIIREEGVFGLYRGIGACLVKVIPAVAISYATYEFMCGKLGVNSFGSKS